MLFSRLIRVTANGRLDGAWLDWRIPTSANCNAAKSSALITTTQRPSLWIWALNGVQLGLLCFCSISPLGRLNSRRSCSDPSVSLSPLVARGCWISSFRAMACPSTKGGAVSIRVGVSGASAMARTLISTFAIVDAVEVLLCSVATACHSKLSWPDRSAGGTKRRSSRSLGAMLKIPTPASSVSEASIRLMTPSLCFSIRAPAGSLRS